MKSITLILLLLTFSFTLSVHRKKHKTKRQPTTIGEALQKTHKKHKKHNFEAEFESFENSLNESIEKRSEEFDHLTESMMADLFSQFKDDFEFKYTKGEERYRYDNFKKGLEKIRNHNRSGSTYRMAVNEFIVTDKNEFEMNIVESPLPIKKTRKRDKNERLLGRRKSPLERLGTMPVRMNWAEEGMTTPVKYQGKCSGCYVFSAMAALESAILIRFGKSLILSEQEIIDCSYGFRNNGCKGGQPGYVFDYIRENGINLLNNYKYIFEEKTCEAPTKKGVFKRLVDYFQPEPNVISLIEYLQYGPIAVNHFIPDDFKYYSSGIFQTNDCDHQITINHSSLLVGYDFSSNPPHFILKNSWGVKWGDAGFYKVPIGELSYDNPGFCYLANNGYNVFPIIN